MNMFILGAIIGIITGGFTILLIAALHVHEVESENEYLKQQLKEQLIEENIGTFTDEEVSRIIKRWTK